MKHVIRWFFTGVFFILLIPSGIWAIITVFAYWKDIPLQYKDLIDVYNSELQ